MFIYKTSDVAVNKTTYTSPYETMNQKNINGLKLLCADLPMTYRRRTNSVTTFLEFCWSSFGYVSLQTNFSQFDKTDFHIFYLVFDFKTTALSQILNDNTCLWPASPFMKNVSAIYDVVF